MPGKRKLQKVPQALYSELSEYSSLLRALSTNDSFDFARRLTEPGPSAKRRKATQESQEEGRENEDTLNTDEEGSQLEAPPRKRRRQIIEDSPAPETSPAPPGIEEDADVPEGNSQPQPREEKPRGRVRKRDTWTRWPLLVKDLRVPEWGLQDEIGALVRQCLRNNPHSSDEDEDGVSSEDVASADAPSWLPHLTQSASGFLSSLFALLAHHTPARPQSMQDRLNPLDWKMVLDIVASCGDVDSTVINNVKTRMEAIYGPHDSPAIARLEVRAATKARAAATFDEADDALFLSTRPRKRQPKRVLEEMDSDDLDDS
ncbi:hypothetical protein MSAN_00927600 [Mycena sanguinolenta]|uniref:Uncharacterized protein n=1 Tax=Mycena sanguinolenta TaxID=230812 RepID=A0A8H6YZL7_9AGAR|nr:hypothetical protein MSAN_00927600 [Mycena sanguinolenta]